MKLVRGLRRGTSSGFVVEGRESYIFVKRLTRGELEDWADPGKKRAMLRDWSSKASYFGCTEFRVVYKGLGLLYASAL